MHPNRAKSHFVKYAGLVQIMQLIQYPHVSLISTVITNEFVEEGFYLSHHSMDGYEAMGFDVTQVTQDVEQILFTIKTNMPIPVLVYGDAFQWAKYGHHILPSNLGLKSHHKTDIHQFFWNSLIEFLRTDLDGHLVPSNLDLIPATATCSLRAPSELSESFQRAFSS
jgi:hypothetical protein